MLKVRWKRFIEYLDWVSNSYVIQIWENQGSIKSHVAAVSAMREAYFARIVGNYIAILVNLTSPDKAATYFNWGRVSPMTRRDQETFKNLLDRLGELEAFNTLSEVLKRVLEEFMNEASYRARRLGGQYREWGRVAETMTYNCLALLVQAMNDRVAILETYLYYRKLIEFLLLTGFYYASINKENDPIDLFYSLLSDRRKVTFKPLKGGLKSSEIPCIETLTMLGYTRQEDYCAKLERLYQATSVVLHRIQPIPFYSLLEWLIARKLVEKLAETLADLLSQKTKTKLEVPKRTSSDMIRDANKKLKAMRLARTTYKPL